MKVDPRSPRFLRAHRPANYVFNVHVDRQVQWLQATFADADEPGRVYTLGWFRLRISPRPPRATRPSGGSSPPGLPQAGVRGVRRSGIA